MTLGLVEIVVEAAAVEVVVKPERSFVEAIVAAAEVIVVAVAVVVVVVAVAVAVAVSAAFAEPHCSRSVAENNEFGLCNSLLETFED